jgi:hypothetical protein
MPHGFGYRMIGGLVACSDLDEFGNPVDNVSFPASLTPKALYFSGLITETEYEEAAFPAGARDLRSSGATGSSNDIGHVVSVEGDSAGGDGASGDGDGGGACGGGCGGGGGCGS